MKIALIYPPTADPTAPYLSVPALTGYLRSKGVDVLPIDANIECYDLLLRSESLRQTARQIDRRLARLKKKPFLDHTEQMACVTLSRATEVARGLPDNIEDAVAVMRDRSGKRFFDPVSYETAVGVIESALEMISAAYTPLVLDFSAYRTPFSLLDIREIRKDARPERNPFHAYFSGVLCDRLEREGVRVAGISVAFPGQIQPAYALAYILRLRLPHLHITVGGPAMTQILNRLATDVLGRSLEPFHSAILFEGEAALYDLVLSIEKGKQPSGVIRGKIRMDLSGLPSTDYGGMPLETYLSPEPVLSYDATRGCYWGKCAFCHYGLSETGTAPYRERPTAEVVKHLDDMAKQYNCGIFYLSQDTIMPATAQRLAEAVHESDAAWRWACDIRPEPFLTPECCRQLVKGGVLSLALGIESGSKRVLRLINKGISRSDMRSAAENLAKAGIAVEWMCFTHFPTETYSEALETLHFIQEQQHHIALFTCGDFSLVHRARVACRPEEYGICEVWHAQGDEFIQTLFYRENTSSKNSLEYQKIDAFVEKLSRWFWLHNYPWAGSLSTAHSLLWYRRFGPDVFRKISHMRLPQKPVASSRRRKEIEKMAMASQENEENIWHTLIYKKRSVSPKAYRQMAAQIPSVSNPFRDKLPKFQV
jgi:anaerobic magnesium-protoporphyrin IX monomethyl ester cyclase